MAKSTLVVQATGTGKTIVMGEIAAKWPTGRVMVIAHREELITQAAKKISLMTGEQCGIEMGDEHRSNEQSAYRRRVIVGSVQTLTAVNDRRLLKYDPMEFSLLMIDEAHHATAPTYRRIVAHFQQNPDLYLLGVTATPDRADEEALGQLFESVAFEYGILDGIKDGWLVPINQQFVHVEGLDLSGCKSDKIDLKESDVARVMAQEGLLHKVVDPVIEIAGDTPSLIFAASVEHAHKMAEIFNRHKPRSAHAIDGTTDKDERRRLLASFSRGEYQYLVNMGVFLEGFDEPTIGCVAMARPTKSRALYAQVAGRGTRPLPGLVDGLGLPVERCNAIATSAKPSMLMLDFVGNSGRHKLVCTADILGGNESDEVVERATENAKQKSKGGKRVDTQQELEIAKEQLEQELKDRHRRDAEAVARREKIVAKAKFNTKSVNPFDIFDVVPKREPGWHKGRKPTSGMVSCLEKFKVDKPTIDGLSFCQAQQMIDLLIDRSRKGLATPKQVKTLGKFGYSVDVSFKEASKIIDAIAANGWKRPPQERATA